MQKVDFDFERKRLIDSELREYGIKNEAVLRAMREVPREEFVSDEMREFAYLNVALPINSGQTISQPYIVALMAEVLAIAPGDRVLEIGTGSGYAAAVLSRLAKDVYTVERLGDLAKSARSILERLGYTNIHVLHGDGTLGWPEEAPFDAIVVAAGGPQFPPALLQQLRIGGRMVIPVGEEAHAQRLILMIRRGTDDFEQRDLGGVRFVSLIGKAGWHVDDDDDKSMAAFPRARPVCF